VIAASAGGSTSWWRSVGRQLRGAGAEWFVRANYAKKWLVLGAIIGIVAGFGAVIFYEALRQATHLFLGVLAGYSPPNPAGEGGSLGTGHFARAWAVPLIVAGGGLLSGLLVFGIAPEAEGHGTDAAISAVHDNPRGIRFRTVVVKIVASALTIGSGGSGGREGPTGQISAGFASLLSRIFDLSPADARLAVATGIGSGIGSIFGAPLGGAVLATEILYRDDFEVEALLPCFIASIVGYSLFGAIEGYGPLFGYVSHYKLTSPFGLLWFAILGVLGGIIGLFYAKGFYGLGGLFARLPAPRSLRPALGGLLVGAMALAIPEVLGTGYGWIQQGLGPGLLKIPLWIVVALPFARILATGLSIGSGGSGGIFGPGMVIGAFSGAAFWDLLHRVVPSMGHSPAPFVVVGMMACFGSIARAPLAIMLMVAEMTDNLTIVIPAMVAVGIATLIVRRSDDTIYRSQLRNRAEAPAHRILTGMPLLNRIAAAQAMARPRLVLGAEMPCGTALRGMTEAGVTEAPVVDSEGRFTGVVRNRELEDRLSQKEEIAVGGLVDSDFSPVQQGQHLDVALEILTTTAQTWMPVTNQDRQVVGTLAMSDMVRSYRRELQTSLRKVAELTGASGIYEARVEEGSVLSGLALRDADVPAGVIVTAIERGRTVVLPEGGTVLQPGDRLMLLGSPEKTAALGRLAGGNESGENRGQPARRLVQSNSSSGSQ
jgi:CIC family chloride channel protein